MVKNRVPPCHDLSFISKHPPTVAWAPFMTSWHRLRIVIIDMGLEKTLDISVVAGAEEKVIEKLSQDARDRIAIAISSFTAIKNQLVRGNVKTSLLKIILERRNVFLDLLKIGNKSLLVIKDFSKNVFNI